MTQQKLAERVNEIGGEGWRWTKATIAKIEPVARKQTPRSGGTGVQRERRRVTIDELIVLAMALDCSPEALLLPRERNAPIRLGRRTFKASVLRAWLGGTPGVGSIGPFGMPAPELGPAYQEWEHGLPSYTELLGEEWLRAFAVRGAARDMYLEMMTLLRELAENPQDRMFDPIELLGSIENQCESLRRHLQREDKGDAPH